MILSKQLKISFVFVSSLFLTTACNNNEIPDFWGCVSLGNFSGYCETAITGKESIVTDKNTLNGQSWEEIVRTGVLIPKSSYADLKKFILKDCVKYNKCDAQQSKVVEVFSKLESVQKELGNDI